MGAQGSVEIDFGAFPGKSDASVVITGQAAILSGSLVEAWILPKDTTDHKADEHMVETLKVFAATIVAGTGFTIYGVNTSEINEPATRDAGSVYGGKGTLLYGKFNIGWVWS